MARARSAAIFLSLLRRLRRGLCGFGGRGRCLRHLEALDFALGGGIRHVAPADLVLLSQQCSIHRLRCAGVVVYFVDVAPYFFSGKFG